MSIMKNYNIIPLSGQIDYKAPMVVLHNGLDLNVNEMMLRIFQQCHINLLSLFI